ncbi:hypothetical protein ACQP2F_33420 [Actinoplanes sp. CA-030573]|uniref:hypothetical protein n=1 Tax=Actinoplanes sp. CA-030573 TaxID=3239898 RepID=UPI003D8CC2EA
MASDSTNVAIEQMRRRHAAQESALRAVAVARGGVEKAQDRRAAELERLDAAVSEAQGGHDEALAVLAELVPAAEVADYAGESVARVREAQKRADAAAVSARVAELTEGLAKRRGPGRPRGLGRGGAAVVESRPDAASAGGGLAAGPSSRIVAEGLTERPSGSGA